MQEHGVHAKRRWNLQTKKEDNIIYMSDEKYYWFLL